MAKQFRPLRFPTKVMLVIAAIAIIGNVISSTIDIPGFTSTRWQALVPSTLLLVAPAWVLWINDRTNKHHGHCVNCGYNLKGNLSGKCSECGTPIHQVE